MIHPRIDGHSTLLADGTVLVVGGGDSCVTAGAWPGSELAEIYDPTADRWTAVGSLNKPRAVLSLVAQPDGTAMVLGGINEDDVPFSSTKVYSPGEREWTNGPLMARAGAVSAVTLSDGRIVAAQTGDTEILESGSARWRRSTPPPRSMFIDGLVPLANDLVAAIGERDTADREVSMLIFDPAREQWRDLDYPGVRSLLDVVGLRDGSVLVIGEEEGGSHVRRYIPPSDRWEDAAQLAQSRTRSLVTMLNDGRVLVTSGVEAVVDGTTVTEGKPLRTTEIYDPASDAWTEGPSLLAPRPGGRAITLDDSSVLVFGGYGKAAPVDPTPDTGSPPECPEPLATTERLVVDPAS